MSTNFYNSFILPYTKIIIKICRAYTYSQEDFEDYFQEACYQIWKSKNSFKGKAQWSTWVYKITLNVCLTLVKKDNKQNQPLKITNEPYEDNTAFSNENINLLYKAIKKLSEIDRAIILLYLEEKTYAEIATIMGTNPNQIGVRINRIKKQLKIILNGKIN